MKSGKKAIKSNKTTLKTGNSTKKKDIAIKANNQKKENIKINLAETNRKKNENINTNKNNNNVTKKSQLIKTKIKTMIRKPTEQQNNISVIVNEPTIKKKVKQEDEITDHSVASKKSIMKDGVLLIDRRK